GKHGSNRADHGDRAIGRLKGRVHGGDVVDDGFNFDGPQFDLPSGDFGVVKDVASECIEVTGGAADVAKHFLRLLAKLRIEVLKENFGIRFHGADGGTEIVGDGVGKAFEVGDGVAEP